MTIQPTPLTKPEASPHRYRAAADVLSAHFEQPIMADIKGQASVVLPEDGKYTFHSASALQLFGVLSYSTGYTQVAGHPSSDGAGFTTLATSVVENLNVLDVVTADRVVGQISTVHPAGDGEVPSVSFVGTRFDNLQINGNEIEVERDLDILGPRPASGRSYFEDAGVLERIAHQYAAIGKVRDLPDWTREVFWPDEPGRKIERLKFSLVRNVLGAPGISFGHVIDLPNFGRIFLGELTVERKDNEHIFNVSMIRLELYSVAKGIARIVNVRCSGGANSETKRESERRYNVEELGPDLGLVTERFAELDLSTAMPRQEPPDKLIEAAFLAGAQDSGPTPELRRANVWSAALETHLLRAGDARAPSATVLTTYGFFRTPLGMRLGVIHYLQPSAFSPAKLQPIEIMGWTFPVITRPWLPTQNGGPSRLDGNCWVKFADEKGEQKLGILTARHALKQGSAKRPSSVSFDVLRPKPPKGRVHRQSDKMDVALVAIDEDEWDGKVAAPHSRVVGFKPIRLITGHGTVDADIVEHQGFTFATIPSEPGKEPLNALYMFFNKSGEPGDSGCLVLDLEFAQAGPRPYLIYLGKYRAQSREVGYGLLIEQANKVWGLECYINANPERK
jgi:hypothetical protein